MKKKTMLALLAVPLFFACGKKDAPQPASTQTTTTVQSKVATTTPGGGPKINSTIQLIPTKPDYGWCAAPPEANCVILSGVDVKPSLKAKLDVATTGGPSSVASVFNTSDALVLLDWIGLDMYTNLRSGTYNMAKSYDDGTTATYIVGEIRKVNP